MNYFKCKRCEYISKQKIDMKRHLEKNKKCTILNNYENKSENQLYNESLIPHNIDNGLNLNLSNKIKEKEKKFCCERCEYKCSEKSNLSKHMKNSKRCKKIYEESIKNNTIDNTNSNTSNNNYTNSNNTINSNNTQNINIVNNNININLKSLREFEEEWDTSNITTEMKKKLLLGHSKFTNTLKSILTNDENLNVILKDESTGIVYKLKNDEYEAMHVNDILDVSMDKIYKHLRDFIEEIINVDNKDNKTIIHEIDKKYYNYKKDLKIKKDADGYLVNIFNENKDKSIEKFVEKINNVSTTNNENEENKKLEDLY